MTSNLSIFSNPEFGSVRVLKIDEEPMFLGTDVANALGYSNAPKAVQMHVDEEDKKTLDFKGFSQIGKSLWEGNDYSNKIMINESGVYSLIFSSKLESAKRFKYWVTSEVLPSIRKNGGYIMGQENETMTDLEFLASALQTADKILKERNERITKLQTENETQKQQITEMEPKVSFYEQFLNEEGYAKSTDIAKNFRITATKLHKILYEKGIIYPSGDDWYVYANHAHEGLMKNMPTTGKNGICYYHNRWTLLGVKKVCEILLEEGYVPIMSFEDFAESEKYKQLMLFD